MTNSIKYLLLASLLLPACKKEKEKNTEYVSPGIKKYTARMAGVHYWRGNASPPIGWSYPNGINMPVTDIYGDFWDTLAITVLNDSMIEFLGDTFFLDYSQYPLYDSNRSLHFTNKNRSSAMYYDYLINTMGSFYFGDPPLRVMSLQTP